MLAQWEADDFAKLIELVGQGDVDSCQTLNKMVSKIVHDVAKGRLVGELASEVSDVVQETWVRVFRSIRDGRAPAVFAFSAWLTRIAICRCVEVVRRRRRERKLNASYALGLSSEVPEPSTAKKLLALDAFEKILSSFAGAERRILLCIAADMTNAEAAASTGLNEGTYRRRKSEVLGRARDLGDHLLEEWDL